MSFWEHIVKFNEGWNDLPRRISIVLLVLAALFLVASFFPYIAPSVIAMAFAWLIRPVAVLLEKAFRKIHLPAKVASVIAVVIMYGVISVIVVLISAPLFSEVRSLIAMLPGYARQAAEFVQQITVEINSKWVLDEWLVELINNASNEAVKNLSGQVTGMLGQVASWTLGTAMNMPQMILSVVLTIMGTIYMVADRERIFAFFRRWIPTKASGKLKLLKDTVFRGIAGQIKAALIMMALIAVELSIGFTIMKIPYAVLLGLIIGIMDALPIVGAGLFLIPMAIYGFVVGNFGYGVGIAVLYILTIITRQIVEPRIVSVQLGLYPLVTMAAMYAGLYVLGFAGMLLGPVMVLILKAALSPSGEEAATEKRKIRKFTKSQKKPPAASA